MDNKERALKVIREWLEAEKASGLEVTVDSFRYVGYGRDDNDEPIGYPAACLDGDFNINDLARRIAEEFGK